MYDYRCIDNKATDSEVGILVAKGIVRMIGRLLLMKKTLVCMTGVIFLLAAFAFAADKPATVSNQTVLKTAKMNARGKVVEIFDKAIKIERSIKGNVEIMEFVLESPVKDIVVNDSVKIDYSVKDGKLTASRVAKLGAKNSGKNGTKQAKEKPASVAK